MFPIHCCCCLKNTCNLLSTKTKSSHKDGKTLLNYLNTVFGTFPKQHQSSQFICTRCSKALQVAYHFINMVKNSEESERNATVGNEENIFHNSTYKGIQHQVKDEQSTSLNGLCIENQLERQANKMSFKEIVSLEAPNNFAIFFPEFLKADSKVAVPSKKYNMCNICNECFDDHHRFEEHNKQKHRAITPYKCKFCSFYTCYTESFFRHCEKKHGLSNVALDSYQNKPESKEDVTNPVFEITYLCIPCSFKGCSQTIIDEHILNEHCTDEYRESFVRKMVACPKCYRSFLTLKSAKIHYSMYHNCSIKTANNNECNKRMFACEKCDKLFDLKLSLILHRRVCDELKSVKCNFCKLTFASVLKYERHLQDKHFVDIKHECETCGKKFNCSEYLTVHRKRHNERYFKCNLCPKNYINNAELRVHTQRIHDIKHAALTCAICSKKFATLSLLKYHENRSHEACSFITNSSSPFQIHQHSHIADYTSSLPEAV